MSMIEDIKRDREAGTPGPWRTSKVNPSRVFGPDSQPVMDRDPTFSQEVKFEANARRIARIPDLEAALLAADELARAVDGLHDSTGLSSLALTEALAAYRRATGEGEKQ